MKKLKSFIPDTDKKRSIPILEISHYIHISQKFYHKTYRYITGGSIQKSIFLLDLYFICKDPIWNLARRGMCWHDIRIKAYFFHPKSIWKKNVFKAIKEVWTERISPFLETRENYIFPLYNLFLHRIADPHITFFES